ncbi:MAG: protein kinase [Myxococcota bacterium]|nr:protein kinase [Myxococcota bacterium]
MPEIGQRIGPFTLVEWISSDKNSSFFRAEGVRGGVKPSTVAIRISNMMQNVAARKELNQEFSILNLLNNAHIPKAIAHYPSQGAIAMEWIEGVSLREILDQVHQINSTTAIEIILEVCGTLKYIHSIDLGKRKLIHGRICPENIIINRNGEIFLMGLGKTPHAKDPSYSPPEQALRAFIDWRTDQWALGALLIELFTSQKLYSHHKNLNEASKIGDVSSYLNPLKKQFPEIATTCKKMLSPAAGERYQDEEELFSALLSSSHEIHGIGHKKELVALTYKNRTQNQKPTIQDAMEPNPVVQASVPNQPAPIQPPSKPKVQPHLPPLKKVIELDSPLQVPPADSLVENEEEFPSQTRIRESNNMEKIAMVFIVINFIVLFYTLTGLREC